MPLDPHHLDFNGVNLSYEESVLFLVANFQYLFTCMSFSIAKPFRKPIWTNIPFTICVVILFVLDTLFVFLPSDNKMSLKFDIQPFKTKDGTTYYSYRYWIALGILLNSICTYVAELLIVNVLTKRADNNLKEKKEAAFHAQMRIYKAQANEITR